MQSLENFSAVLLHRDPVDMRKSINGLAIIVIEELGLSFDEARLFVFVSRCGKKLKMLYWDKSGFAMWYKRLEKQKFCWPRLADETILQSSAEQLRQLLYGFDAFQQPHKTLQYQQIC